MRRTYDTWTCTVHESPRKAEGKFNRIIHDLSFTLDDESSIQSTNHLVNRRTRQHVA